MFHGDPDNPKKNPHPTKRYELTVTAEAPGPWDSVRGYINYDVVNLDCTRKNEFLGVHIQPQGVGIDIELTRVDEKTWKGHFFRDYLLDEDYYGLGVCHWDAASVSSLFVVHDKNFAAGTVLEDGRQKGALTKYFRKVDYSQGSGDALASTAETPEVILNASAYFSIHVAVKEDSP